ncbi:hypothetical protein O1611_g6464 [Lasiodiplodia mahajangana]|uniref:Uncharacterized protein n=1 Tax=Lasiodiplodia mahajangana TaxID=1108764 RepID=A0ACC2JI20_9PEZI|nr:hypothetical protein O1611_g6464 [Lasiodiplodia mahajangana]
MKKVAVAASLYFPADVVDKRRFPALHLRVGTLSSPSQPHPQYREFSLPNMAGGVKKPVNIFKLKDLNEPKGVFNWRLWFAVCSFGLLGAARGVDEGLINGAFNSKVFQASINYDSYNETEQANIKANVSAMVQVGSVAGALIAFLVCDRIGRFAFVKEAMPGSFRNPENSYLG